MKEIPIDDIKLKVHPYAVEAIIRLTTDKYPSTKFFFSAVNDFASKLPEVGMAIGDHLTKDTVWEMDTAYSDILDDVAMENDVDLFEEERLYDGMTIVSSRIFDKTYLTENIFGFYAVQGKFYEKSTVK